MCRLIFLKMILQAHNNWVVVHDIVWEFIEGNRMRMWDDLLSKDFTIIVSNNYILAVDLGACSY